MPTLRDIAEKVGVSPAVVSLVLNNKEKKGRIKHETSERVRRAARKMGYKLDVMAQALTTGKTNVIGFVSPVLHRSIITGRIISGMVQAATRNNYLIKMINAQELILESSEKLLRRKCDEIIDTCVRQRLSALVCHLILSPKTVDYLYENLKKNGIDLANITCYSVPEDVLCVNSDDIKGGEIAVEYLYNLGHRKIAFVSLPFASLNLRHAGFQRKMKEYNLPVADNHEIIGKYQLIKDRLGKMFAGKERPTAVFCGGDDVALTVISKIKQDFDIRIPEDLSIIGFGNLEYGEMITPALTTVYEPFTEMGERIVEKLIARFNKKILGDNQETLDVHIIERESTRKV